MDPFHIFSQGTEAFDDQAIQMPYTDQLTTVPTSEIENIEIPVKLGLRFAIESRRFANGLDIPEIEMKPVQTSEELSEDQLEKRRLRRERNKIAASKCRLKRKVQANKLQQSSKELQSANEDLESLIGELNKEKLKLETMLKKHHCLLSDQSKKTSKREF
ncbi:cyclic AMP-dependent transcription factor ATF-3-like [Xenia sp. Carnegie-2017]|uniref:cyclic AMP-dependent transcription factor ATF-3-like n=1 Tax=Xenia sp. Carnegie-2017 TaxID=2897299 RepID=UPI001F04C439|nr:cyclic AMP-dependent transcription factor ATF-3-like [Xenia sp. Carnegie-2017]